MLKRIKGVSLGTRILLLPALFAVGLIVLQFMNYSSSREIMDRVVYPSYEDQMLSAHKNTMKALVEAESTALADKFKALVTREERIAATIAETDPIRFFDDGSGYFFAYDLSGVRINVPINKAQNGKNLIDLQDQRGKRFVEEIVKVAKNGGGFVEYHFEKQGKGIQPKLSYVKAIPGTDLLIGTGVYIDNVEAERNALQGKVEQTTTDYLRYDLFAFALILGITIAVSFFTGRSVKRSLLAVIAGLTDGSQRIASTCTHIASSSQQLAEGASKQAAAIEETSSSLEEMTSMTRQNADNAGQANQLMQTTNTVVGRAGDSMNRLTVTMREISSASEETQKIIKTIDEIAFQTNLLALNAAVEAARAGEAGAGFAVVADEVRNLAMRAAEAAKNTTDLLEGTVRRIKEGVELVGKTGEEFSQVSGSAVKMGEFVGEIAAASQEQAQGIDLLNRAVSDMDRVVQENAAHAEESASASEELRGQAMSMRGFVADLVTLVGGAGDAGAKGRTPASQARAMLQSIPGSASGKAPHQGRKDGSGGNGKLTGGTNGQERFPQKIDRFLEDGELTDF